jgi:hypothetical protein
MEFSGAGASFGADIDILSAGEFVVASVRPAINRQQVLPDGGHDRYCSVFTHAWASTA